MNLLLLKMPLTSSSSFFHSPTGPKIYSNLCLFWEALLEDLKAEITTIHSGILLFLWICQCLFPLELTTQIFSLSIFNSQKKPSPMASNTFFTLISTFLSLAMTLPSISLWRLLHISSLTCKKWKSRHYFPSPDQFFLSLIFIKFAYFKNLVIIVDSTCSPIIPYQIQQ